MEAPILPFEVWSKIFEFSCRDSGYTGQSLSRTSRMFNALSTPYKFQSISLQNLKYILKFYDLLCRTPPNLRRIQYLCITFDGLWRSTYSRQSNWENESYYETDSDTEDSSKNGDSASFDSTLHQSKGDREYSPPHSIFDQDEVKEDSDDEEEPLSKEELNELEDERNALELPEEDLPSDHPLQGCLVPADQGGSSYFGRVFLRAFYGILQLCDDSLLVLSVHVDDGFSSFPVLPPLPMPRLQELTWAVPRPYVSIGSPSQVLFPALERLRVTAEITALPSQIIATHCPKLRYLRTLLRVLKFDRDLVQEAHESHRRGDSPPMYLSVNTPSSVIQHLLDFDYESNICLLLSLRSLGFRDKSLKDLVDPRVKFCNFVEKQWDDIQSDWQGRVLGEVGGWEWDECMFDMDENESGDIGDGANQLNIV